MRVGVYIDGHNLHYGARAQCGRGTPGWRWLDVRTFVERAIARRSRWPDARIDRVVHCTSRVDGTLDASAHADQDVYLKALVATSSVDWIEYGNCVARVRHGPAATQDARTGKPVVLDAEPVVSYLHLAEKGSDVNLATHLLVDILTDAIDACVVVSNDSDLALPIQTARVTVPVGLVNPRGGYFAGDLAGKPHDGVGNHWWWKPHAEDFRACQLPDPAGGYARPAGW